MHLAHGVCNKFQPDRLEQATNERAALERYLHYFHRWNIHQQSKKFETKLREDAINKMMKLRDEGSSLNVSYIEEATEQLIEVKTNTQM